MYQKAYTQQQVNYCWYSIGKGIGRRELLGQRFSLLYSERGLIFVLHKSIFSLELIHIRRLSCRLHNKGQKGKHVNEKADKIYDNRFPGRVPVCLWSQGIYSGLFTRRGGGTPGGDYSF
jgi:hypothetical protein